MSDESQDGPPIGHEAVDWILDRFVYGPYGLLVGQRSDLESAAQVGRDRISQQVNNARFLGQMTVTHGSAEVRRRVSDLLGSSGSPVAEKPVESAAESSRRSAGPKAPRPDPIDHVISGYDDLSASQVVKLMDGLSRADLIELRGYESATRGRRTIVTRAGQLLDEA